ncbi:MAG: alpha/beta fold hydrolase [Rhodospirillales bacterium]|nr:MAG: alpha/beta fold hydrolase [Rhodospirillales bacterium]
MSCGQSMTARPTSKVGRAGRVLAIALLAAIVEGCGGPPLEAWHTERLRGEFTAGMAGEVGGFDGYRRLEDQLFAELETKVYDRTGTGPEYALVRYSAGSAADPRRREPDWNRSFELPAEAPVGGVLLLHGMSDSPYSLRALGVTLNRRGYWVVGLRLPGHGTAPSGLKYVRWEDMAAATELAVAHLAARIDAAPVHIIGYSNGAALAVDFALKAADGRTKPAPASLVLVSPAVGVHGAAGLAGLKDGLAVLPGLERFAWLSILPEFDPYKYNSFATNAGAQVHRLTTSLAGRIRGRARAGPIEDLPPILVFKSTVDATVSIDAVVDNLLSHLAPHRNELVLFDINRAAVASAILIDDPGPFTNRLLGDGSLPFTLTLIANEGPDSDRVVRRRKAPFSTEMSTEPAGVSWPSGVLSLSHVALPFPPDDPLYGREPPPDQDMIFLGQIAVRGERGLLRFPDDWLLRLRHNPFFDLLEARTLEWLNANGRKPAEEASTRRSTR